MANNVKAAVKNAARKIAESKSGKSDVQNWTNDEVYEGLNRNERKAAGGAAYLQKPWSVKSEGSRARVEDFVASSNDSLGILRTERMRRRRKNATEARNTMQRNMDSY